jgi:hypothetical protein
MAEHLESLISRLEEGADDQGRGVIDTVTEVLRELGRDSDRWRWLTRHASLGFDGAPSWNAVVRLPVFDSGDQTITALVDRALAAVGAA